MNSKKIGLISLGCPKNRVDSELVLGALDKKGYKLTSSEREADVLIVNTCGFIQSAKEESIETILEMAEYKQSGKCRKLIVMGCLSQRYKDELLDQIPEIDYLIGAGDFKSVIDVIDFPDEVQNRVKDPVFAFSNDFRRLLTTPSHFAYLKISEGCSNKCSFCIIPKLRGPFKSRTIESVFEEAKFLADSGVKELNLISQDTTMYGFDLGLKKGLKRLIKKLASIDKIKWIRLLYCYPTFIDDDFIDMFLEEEKVCRYVDLPFQHIHNDILKKMLRNETEQKIRSILDRLRSRIPGIAVRTSLIVGFPGETERRFKSLLQFVKEQQFEHLGVFSYSKEEGTSAADLPGQVPEEVKIERRKKIMEVQQKISFKNNRKLEGSIQEILVDESKRGEEFLITGRTRAQAPSVDGLVYIEKSEVRPGEIAQIRITKGMEYDLIGEICP